MKEDEEGMGWGGRGGRGEGGGKERGGGRRRGRERRRKEGKEEKEEKGNFIFLFLSILHCPIVAPVHHILT